MMWYPEEEVAAIAADRGVNEGSASIWRWNKSARVRDAMIDDQGPRPGLTIVYGDAALEPYDTVDCESPDRVWRIQSEIRDLGEFIEPVPCAAADLLLCHTQSLIDSVQRDRQLFQAPAPPAGGAIIAAERCLRSPAFALVRPPGHHAGRAFNGGFCFFNNIAVAVSRLLASGAVRSALIVDIDLHYGNGTDDIFRGNGRVTFRNLSATDRPAFFHDLEEALSDAATFDVVGCSAGFDTYIRDWGNLLLTEDFRRAGEMLAAASTHLFSVLEGGYYVADLGKNVRAFLEGIRSGCS
jgi:acetoin utilization deacetylase AcuC-like enzyme